MRLSNSIVEKKHARSKVSNRTFQCFYFVLNHLWKHSKQSNKIAHAYRLTIGEILHVFLVVERTCDICSAVRLISSFAPLVAFLYFPPNPPNKTQHTLPTSRQATNTTTVLLLPLACVLIEITYSWRTQDWNLLSSL